jgi:hypothetical protein
MDAERGELMATTCRDCGVSSDDYSLWLKNNGLYCQIDFMERYGYDPRSAYKEPTTPDSGNHLPTRRTNP